MDPQALSLLHYRDFAPTTTRPTPPISAMVLRMGEIGTVCFCSWPNLNRPQIDILFLVSKRKATYYKAHDAKNDKKNADDGCGFHE
jgi:hypothetical protein